MQVYTIIGPAGSGKSSLVRHLSGVFEKGIQDIQFRSVTESVPCYVRLRSAQEEPITVYDLIGELEEARMTGATKALVTLRSDAVMNRGVVYPNAEVYTAEIEEYIGRTIPFQPAEHTGPTNLIAAIAREEFDWV